MKFIPNKWQVLLHAWSVWCMAMSGLLGSLAASEAFFVTNFGLPPGMLALGAAFFNALGIFVRTLIQPNLGGSNGS